MTATDPSSPTSSTIFSAASSAAAALSVATVESGMSDSTPESKAMTGMSPLCACSRRGREASESRAA